MADPRPEPERPSSVLSESWATLSNCDIHSEDEDRSVQTDTASLVGASVPDDVASLDEHDNEHSEAENTDTDSHFSDTHDHYGRDGPDEVEASLLTATASLLSAGEPIVFEEPDDWPETESTLELSHALGPVDETELPGSVKGQGAYRGGEVAATIYQTIAKKGLEPDRPFRVLYIGHPDFKGCVLDKLGDVLIANPNSPLPGGFGESDRFHVVPAAVGADSASGYAELLPLQVQLTVDECMTVYGDSADPSKITVVFNNGGRYSSSRAGFEYKISSESEWTPPDLAIFFISEFESNFSSRIRRHKAEEFMTRHAIPCLFISEKPGWDTPCANRVRGRCGFHMVAETYDPGTQQKVILGRSLVDLNTFERICPEQLNRTLSALVAPRNPGLVSGKKRKGKGQEFRDVEKYPSGLAFPHIARGCSEPSPALRQVMMLLICLIAMSLGYAGIKYVVVLLVQYLSGSAVVTSMQSSSAPLSPSSTASFTRSSTKSLSTSSLITSTSDLSVAACGAGNEPTVNDYLAKITQPMIESPNDSESFQVHVIGDCHVIIRTPSARGWWKSPAFIVEVTRAEEELPFDVSRLFDGVYALRLVREDAYGLLNITIKTKTKPGIEQVTEVDFGTPWLKIASWKQVAQTWSSQLLNDLNSAQAGLSEAYNRVAVDLQVMGNTLRDEVYPARHNTLERAFRTANAVVERSKELYDDVQDMARKHIGPSSVLLRKRAEGFHRDASGFAHKAWKTVSRQATKARASAKGLDLSHLGRQAREIGSCRSLAVAQQHARRLARWGRGHDSASSCHSTPCQWGRVWQKTRR